MVNTTADSPSPLYIAARYGRNVGRQNLGFIVNIAQPRAMSEIYTIFRDNQRSCIREFNWENGGNWSLPSSNTASVDADHKQTRNKQWE